MGNLRTIAAAAAVTAAGILLGSQADAGPPLKVYQLAADSLGNMWRLNTDDGALMACWQVNYGIDISCAAASGPAARW